MADLPILMSAPMVRALLREIELPGTGKTQTRRVLTKLRRFGPILEFERSDTPGYDWHFRDRGMRWHDLRNAEFLKVLPYAVGDRLYVHEAWRSAAPLDDTPPRYMDDLLVPPVRYEADGEVVNWKEWKGHDAGRLRQGMHMPRWASRLTLTVTDVRVQRLQEISRADAIAEGLEYDIDGDVDGRGRHVVIESWRGADFLPWSRDPIEAYADLWDHLNYARGYGWDANPWITAYTFRPIAGNIDQVAT